MKGAAVVAFLSSFAAALVDTNCTTPLPVTGGYFNFSNIRYAAPPIADLRFAAPQPPLPSRAVVQSGQDARICPQALPDWYNTASEFLPQYLFGQRKFNDSSWPRQNLTMPLDDLTTNEDCLFLDVFVPDDVWNQRHSGKKVPVLFWIFGGGYVYGSKTSYGSPSGLLTRSEMERQPGVIYVAPNYRLGAFGWLSGPTFEQDGGLPNAGLHDQRLALEWVHKYIHLFGGDAKRITVFGQSAGGGSILHQITAYGGQKQAPFKQAVLQSPGFQGSVSTYQQEIVFQNFLTAANVTTLAEARKLSYLEVQKANFLTTAVSVYGTFGYGPVVDGTFVPSLPGQLLAHGQFDNKVSVMVGQNKNEGLLFTSPYLANDVNDTRIRANLVQSIPTLKGLPDQVDYILNTLYPPIFDGSQGQGYKDQIGRMAALSAEFAFICNNLYLEEAHNNNTYSYLFDIFPAIHGSDAPYTYYSGSGQPGPRVTAPRIALELQEYITSFAETGTPNGHSGVPLFKMYGEDAQVLDLQVSGVSETLDPSANKRCRYWQSALWF
ncbi:carboxylesterase family protein-like protein [Myriangium duriaei CBS 260.36]|uniref:Carboxylic ester hydrolase n=1 Tax=Myriangium duriaei CBS 260.36 TaxID=1168546 RepID=A0A9P4IRC7_9PEZI|nr:carboxylesterase family protein-like protein [Myriangium duriaei CBS 260.36]